MSKRSERLAAARVIGRHTGGEWALMVLAFRGRCPRCGGREYRLEKDHILPLYVEGSSDSLDNLQPMCAPCNASKGPESIDYRPAGLVAAIRHAVASGAVPALLGMPDA